MDFMTNEWNEREVRQKFYSSRDWRNLRAYVLGIEPFCRRCKVEGYLVAATEVDHIIDVKINPEKRLDIENLQPLCKPCHARKTQIETNKASKGKNKLQQINLWKL